MRIVLLLSALLATHAFAQAPPATLCAGSEVPVFYCPVDGKTLSVCLLDDDRVSYRFGKLGEPEITIDAAAIVSSRGYPGGGETRLRFTRGEYDYLVYDLIANAGYDEETDTYFKTDRAGVYVVRGGQVVANVVCNGDLLGDAGKVLTGVLRVEQEEPFVDLDVP